MRRSIALLTAVVIASTVLLPLTSQASAGPVAPPIASLVLVRQQVAQSLALPEGRVKAVPPSQAPSTRRVFNEKILFFIVVLKKFVRIDALARMHEQLLRNRPAPVRELRVS